MSRAHALTIAATLVLALTLSAAAGCGLEVPTTSAGPDPQDNVGDKVYSTQMLALTHDAIVKTRPQGTALMVKQLNLVLANSGVLNQVIGSVESRIDQPLTDGQPKAACPYLTSSSGTSSVTCRYLVDRAVEDALLEAPKLSNTLQQQAELEHASMETRELSFVKGWINQAVISGIDVGGVHTLDALRQTKVCDQASSPKADAFKAGETQGRAVLEQTEQRVLPTIPKTICETDVIASTIYGEAKQDLVTFQQQSPLCKGYATSDLAVAVDLAQAETNHGEGLREGARQGYEALRVRLVNTWVCWRCGDGKCDPNEDCASCAADCGPCPPVCGDGKCEQGEDCSSCSSDCGACPPKCGNGACESGESCSSCAPDCGTCPAKCGDGSCTSGESCSSCSTDCGACGGQPQSGAKVECSCFYRPARGGAKLCVPKAALNGMNITSGFTLDSMFKQGLQQVQPSQCTNPPQYKTIGSPLVVDLDGNGIHLGAARVRFDLAGTGEPVWIQALGGRDALLTLDLDADGRIASGRELFGNSTACGAGSCADGVEALQQHDSNADGFIDAADPVFARLRLWRDADHDGASSPAELTDLASAGIRAIRLAARTDLTWSDAAGNCATRALTFKRSSGPDGQIHDVWFNVQLDGAPANPRTAGITSTQRAKR